MCACQISALCVCVHISVTAQMLDLELFLSYVPVLKAVLTVVYVTCH
jgi:hypothetical protein